jgi:hypothetical protein
MGSLLDMLELVSAIFTTSDDIKNCLEKSETEKDESHRQLLEKNDQTSESRVDSDNP